MDQYGNPSMMDYMLLTKGISAMNANQKAGRYEDAREGLIEQHGSVQSVVENADPNSLNQYQLDAYKGFAQNYNSAMDSKSKVEVNAEKRNIMAGIKQTGDPFAYMKTYSADTVAKLIAAKDTRELFSQDSTFQKTLYENRKQIADAKSKEVFDALKVSEESLARGDLRTAGRILEGASKTALTRSKFQFDEKAGNFHRFHWSREKGWVDTGERLTVQEGWKFLREKGEKGLSQHFVTEMKTTSQFNRDNISNGGRQGVGKNGEKYNIFSQIITDENGLNLQHEMVYDGNNLVGVIPTTELQQHGITFRNTDQEKAQLELDKGNQAIATSKARERAYNSSAMTKKDETQRKHLLDAFSNTAKMLKSVKDGNGNTFNFVDADALESMSPEQRKPFIQKAVEIAQNEQYDHITRSTAQTYFTIAEKLGYYQPQTSEEAAYKQFEKLVKNGKGTREERIANAKEQMGVTASSVQTPSAMVPTVQSPRVTPPTQSAMTTSSVQVAANTPVSDSPFAAYKGRAIIDKNGTIWAKDKTGQPRRLMRKPPQKIRDGQGQLRNNPKYRAYLEALRELGISDQAGTQLANQ